MTAQSNSQFAVPLHRPEPRVATTKSDQVIHIVEHRTSTPQTDAPRQNRHDRSSSLHHNYDSLSLRKPNYSRAKSVDAPLRAAQTGSSSAALRAAQMSATAHQKHESRLSSSRGTQVVASTSVASHVAAASLAWKKSTAKSANEKLPESRVPSNIDGGLLQPLPITSETVLRKSTDSTRPLQSEFLLPSRSGGPAKSHNSDMMVHEVNNYVNAEQSHQGPLLAARISFAQDREAHAAHESPPSRPPSARPSPFNGDDSRNRSLNNLAHERTETPPIIKKSMESSNRAALLAASSTWASHEHDNPRPTTPMVEPYQYITHKPHTTLRKTHKEELGKFLKHGRVQPMSAADRKRYDGLWAANKGICLEHAPVLKDEIANIVVREIWERSCLQPDILSEIYDLVDRTENGRLTRDEFVVGTWLVDHSLRGRRLPFKRDLTDDIFDGGLTARLGLKLSKKLKHKEKKYLKEEKAMNEKAKHHKTK